MNNNSMQSCGDPHMETLSASYLGAEKWERGTDGVTTVTTESCCWFNFWKRVVLFTLCVSRISCLETCWESSRTATAGKNSGWCSPTSASSSTSHTRCAVQEGHVHVFWSKPDHWGFSLCPQDDYPLASLPLLGYSVTVPSESENIHKDYVFKLHFKSHVYYFRSESEYTYERWEPEKGFKKQNSL